jgi:hypothetical protein
MSELPMRGHFRYLRFKTFSMTPRTPQCEVFCPFLSSSELRESRETPNSQLFQVLGFTPPHLVKLGLRHILHAFMCAIGSLKPSKTKSGKLFTYPLTKLLKIRWTNQHNSLSSCCHVGVYIIIEEVVQVSKRFLPASEGLWYAISLLFKRSPLVFHMLPIPTAP